MADPLSVLGAAVGVTSLILQLADECIKGFKFYCEAVNLPQTHRYLLVRLQIEKQRFLNFGLEANIFATDGTLCRNLQVSRSLILAILAEMKALFEKFAEKNGRYEKIVSQSHDRDNDNIDLNTALMSVLCTISDDNSQIKGEGQTGKREQVARVRGLGKSIVQTARNLRTIVIEPKRLVWAAFDKDSFEQWISKVENLNSFLVALLDSSQLRRLEDSMDTAYFEILQLRNDVVDLTALVKALAPMAESHQSFTSNPTGIKENTLSQAVAEETAAQDTKKSYLKRLAEIKIQFTEIGNLNNKAVAAADFSTLIENPIPVNKLEFADEALTSRNLKRRTIAIYQGRKVWIEWKDIEAGNPNAENIQTRIGLLTDLLRSAKPDGFRAAPCLGYVKFDEEDDIIGVGIVFEWPSDTHSEITTLREMLGRRPKPSLNARMALCAVLARCVYSLHAVNWMHKALRADNIIIFTSSGIPRLDAPFVSGFELSRPSTIDQLTEKPRYDPSEDIYRHPKAQSSQADGHYRKSYDVYSLGVLMIEIALWKRIEDVVGFKDVGKARPSTLRELHRWFLGKPIAGNVGLPQIPVNSESCLQLVAQACGDSFCGVLERCLEMDSVEEPEYARETETAVSLRLQRVVKSDVLTNLERIATSL